MVQGSCFQCCRLSKCKQIAICFLETRGPVLGGQHAKPQIYIWHWLIFFHTTLLYRWWYFKGSVHDIGHVKLTLRGLTCPIHRITSSFLIFATTCASVDSTLEEDREDIGKWRVKRNIGKSPPKFPLWIFRNMFFSFESNSGKILWYLSIRAASSMAAEYGSEAVYMTIIIVHWSLDFEYPYNELPHLHKGSWVKPILNVIGDWESKSCSKTLVQWRSTTPLKACNGGSWKSTCRGNNWSNFCCRFRSWGYSSK